MINYYRSSVRTPPKKAEAAIRPIKAPTLVIWGQRDRYLGPELAEPDHDDVPNLDRVERLPDASHWVHHDEAERVNQLLIDFFAPAKPARELTRGLARDVRWPSGRVGSGGLLHATTTSCTSSSGLSTESGSGTPTAAVRTRPRSC